MLFYCWLKIKERQQEGGKKYYERQLNTVTIATTKIEANAE